MKQLTLENYHLLLPYMKLANYPECNSNIVTLLMWAKYYEVYFTIEDDFALVYTKSNLDEKRWLMPYCTLSKRPQALQCMKQLSMDHGVAFTIYSMTKEFTSWLQQTYPQTFLIHNTYDLADYVYDRFQQQSLSGKKMQKRRNHFHAFLKLYEGRYTYKALEKSDHDAIYAFLDEWKSRKDEEEYETIDAEREGISFMLEHWDELPLLGGCIYVDGKLEAFNIVSYLRDDMVEIHVEKANKHIRGLYIAILKLFLETLPQKINYLNREDDMGLAELRKNKSDMGPIYKIQKYQATLATITFTKASDIHFNDIKALWLESFKDENETTTAFYFTHFYDSNNTYLLTYHDEIISMMQIKPITISYHHKPSPSYFIVGVATNRKYEGCGYMRTLLNNVLNKSPYKEADTILLQAYNYDVYKNFGFHETYQQVRWKVNKEAYKQVCGQFINQENATAFANLYHAFVAHKDGYKLRTSSDYITHYFPYMQCYGLQHALYLENDQTLGYIVFYLDENSIEVSECIYQDETILEHMLTSLCEQFDKVYIHLSTDIKIQGKAKPYTHMAMKTKDAPCFSDPLFINETI